MSNVIKSRVQGRQTNGQKLKQNAIRLLSNVLNDESQSTSDRVKAASAILQNATRLQGVKDEDSPK